MADIKQYQLQQGYLLLQDMFQMFSLPISFSTMQSFTNNAQPQDFNKEVNPPLHTQEMQMRIPQQRRVDGELLHYKKFSPEDDTRRIVWKIYAKSKELMVRMPEIFNPFANEYYFYASFFTKFTNAPQTELLVPLLNNFKQKVANIHHAVVQQEFATKYISDQGSNNQNASVEEKITQSNWQLDVPIHSIVNKKYTTAVCLHSLSREEDVQELCNIIAPFTAIYFIKTSSEFSKNGLVTTLQKIFLLPPSNELELWKSKWRFSWLRKQTMDNEKKIINLLTKNKVDFTIIE